MKVLVFCGSYDKRILSEAMAFGRIYWSDSSLREMLRQISAVDAIFVNSGHVDIEMLEDSPHLKAIICPEKILRGMELSSISALGVAILQMPEAESYSAEWTKLFEKLWKLYLGHPIFPVLNPDVYHHPDWIRMK